MNETIASMVIFKGEDFVTGLRLFLTKDELLLGYSYRIRERRSENGRTVAGLSCVRRGGVVSALSAMRQPLQSLADPCLRKLLVFPHSNDTKPWRLRAYLDVSIIMQDHSHIFTEYTMGSD